MTVGGKGRPVVGRVLAPEGWTGSIDFTESSLAAIESNRPSTPYPPELFRGKATLNDNAWSNWLQKWRKTPEGIAYIDGRVAAHVALAPDGSFRFDDLPAGDYRVTVTVNEQTGRQRGPFERVVKEFTVPMIPGTRRPDPLDVGEIRLTARKPPKAGDPAPDFQATTVDGKAIRLADYRGKFLLLDFGVMWDDQCRLQIARLNEVYQRFGDDDRLAILSLVMAKDDEQSRAFVAGKGQPWPQAIVGPLTNAISSAYGIEDRVPAAILIGPDGKIVVRDLWYQQIIEALGKAPGAAGAMKRDVPESGHHSLNAYLLVLRGSRSVVRRVVTSPAARRPRHRPGLTLIECLVAVSILGLLVALALPARAVGPRGGAAVAVPRTTCGRSAWPCRITRPRTGRSRSTGETRALTRSAGIRGTSAGGPTRR